MITVFALYVVLASMPRFDDSNLIRLYDTQEECERIAQSLMEFQASRNGLANPAKYLNPHNRFVCRAYDGERPL